MSDFLFFSGFEGCIQDSDVSSLFTWVSTVLGTSYTRLGATSGFLGGKAARFSGYSTSLRQSAYKDFDSCNELYIGFHANLQNTRTGWPFLTISGSSNIEFYYWDNEIIRIQGTGITTQDVRVAILSNLYFHFEVYVNRIAGTLIMKINGITEITLLDLNIGTYNNRFRLWALGGSMRSHTHYDNLWVHKSKSLGQCISFFSKPIADGHYAPNSELFHTNDGSLEGWAKLQENDGDDNYIYSSVPDAKFTCKQEEIPMGYQPVAYAIQSIYKHNTGGGLLYVKDLMRYNSLQEDFLGELRAVPDTYSHSYLTRTNYDKAPDGTELTRGKINDMEIGSQLVELEE